MSKTSQRKRAMYTYGYRVGIGKDMERAWHRSSKEGWQHYDSGFAAGRLERLQKLRDQSNPWLDFKALMKRLFRKLTKPLHKKQIRWRR